jgi:uncharacterized protein DUF4062
MPKLRVLVSSTVYDLAPVRVSLQGFIESQGFEPVLSERSDVLYDYRQHTHRNCIDEVTECDMLVHVIGSRFGSELTREDVGQLAAEMDPSLLSETTSQRLSISQAEALKAVINGIPVFAFIDKRVNNDYGTYRENRDSHFAAEIKYPSIPRPETAEYIFRFVELFKKQRYGNALYEFEDQNDIIDCLRKQWSALFRKLLKDAQGQEVETLRVGNLAQEIADLRTVITTTFGAQLPPVVPSRYQELFAFLTAVIRPGMRVEFAIASDGRAWEQLLADLAGIRAVEQHGEPMAAWATVLYREDGEPYLCTLSLESLDRLGAQWDSFRVLDIATRQAVFAELSKEIQSADPALVTPMELDRPPRSPAFTPTSKPGTLRERETPAAGRGQVPLGKGEAGA